MSIVGRIETFLGCTIVSAYLLFAGWYLLSLLGTPASHRTDRVLAASTAASPLGGENQDEVRLLDSINEQRLSSGLTPLAANQELRALAMKRASDMVQRRYYAHKDPDGYYYFDYFQTDTFKHSYNCENLDIQFGQNGQGFVNDWLASTAGHRECMLHAKTSDVGLAVIRYPAHNAENAYLAVVIHAARN